MCSKLERIVQSWLKLWPVFDLPWGGREERLGFNPIVGVGWMAPSLLLSECTPLERCCVHNMSPFVSSSGLSPGSRAAKVQRAKVCLNCTEPSVARSSYWSLSVGRYLLDSRCKGSVVVLARWTASYMAEEPQTSISHQVRERWTTSRSSDFRIWHMTSIWYPRDLARPLTGDRKYLSGGRLL